MLGIYRYGALGGLLLAIPPARVFSFGSKPRALFAAEGKR